MTPEVGMWILGLLVGLASFLGAWALKSTVDLKVELGAQKATAAERKEEIERRFTQRDSDLERTIKNFEQGQQRLENEVVAVHKRLDALYSQLAKGALK